MLTKTPKVTYGKYIKNTAKTILVAEIVAFAISYGVWDRLNTNRGTFSFGIIFTYNFYFKNN